MVLICSYKSNHSILLSDETAVTAGCLCVVSRWFFPVKSCLLTGCYINTTSDLCAWDFSSLASVLPTQPHSYSDGRIREQLRVSISPKDTQHADLRSLGSNHQPDQETTCFTSWATVFGWSIGLWSGVSVHCCTVRLKQQSAIPRLFPHSWEHTVVLLSGQAQLL